MILGVDCGRFKVKAWHANGHFEFFSNIGEARELEFADVKGQDDIIGEYKGRRFTAGTLARRESEYGDSLMTESKLHEDTVILVLTALHKALPSGPARIVTGLPIVNHERDKAQLKELLNGAHRIMINGNEKQFFVNCEVAPEGVGIYKLAGAGTIRGLNIGSRTVNAITFRDGEKIGRESDTFDFGTESGKSRDRAAMARAIAGKSGSLKWKEDDKIVVFGGGATEMFEHLKEFFNRAVLPTNPVFTDAEAFYLTAREIYG